MTRDKRRRSEEWGAAKRASGGGEKSRGVRQIEDVRKNRSDGQEVNRRCGRGRRKVKDGGRRRDSRRRGKRDRFDIGIKEGRGRRDRFTGGVREEMDGRRHFRTEGECRRSKKFWSYSNNHSSHGENKKDAELLDETWMKRQTQHVKTKQVINVHKDSEMEI